MTRRGNRTTIGNYIWEENNVPQFPKVDHTKGRGEKSNTEKKTPFKCKNGKLEIFIYDEHKTMELKIERTNTK